MSSQSLPLLLAIVTFFVLTAVSCGRIDFEYANGDPEATETALYSDTNLDSTVHDWSDSNADTSGDGSSEADGNIGTNEETDTNGSNGSDECPNDAEKIAPGVCGCGIQDNDTDSDGTPDCVDTCPDDPEKTEPGVCACNITDMNGNGVCETWISGIWSFRKPLIIGGRAPKATFTDFPILVNIRSDNDLSAHARNDGFDIRFTSEEGTLLEHELVSYNSANGALVAWLKMPILDTRVDTLLFVYYGNTSVDVDPSVTTVWSKKFLVVWHLDELGNGTKNEYYDSSGNRNHARGGGGLETQTPMRVNGKIAFGQDGDGVDDFISTPIVLSGQSVLTVTAWFYLRSVNNTPRPGLLGQNDSLEMGFYWPDRLNIWTPSVTTTCPGKSIVSVCTPDFTLKTWTHLAVVFDGTNAVLYLDGVEKHVAVVSSVGHSTSSFNLLGRVFDSSGNSLDGKLDEVRVATAKRSAAWIATQYANQSSPDSFYTLGAQQTAP